MDLSQFCKQASGSSFWFMVLAIFVLALSLRLVYFNAVADGPLGNPDSPAYETLGDSLRRNQIYNTPQAGGPGGFPGDLQRPPGYPVFLALTNPASGVNRQWTAIIQSVLSAFFAASLTIAVGRIVNVLVGLLTGAFYACDWVSIIHTPLLIAETVFTVLLTAAVCCFAYYLLKQRIMLAALAGGLLGIASLIKPVSQLVLVAFLLAWAFQPKRRWAGLVFLALYASCVMPWMIRNYQHHQVFTLSAISTASLYFYTAQGAVADHSWRDMYSWRELEERVNSLDAAWSGRHLQPSERKKNMEEEAWRLIKQHWPRVIKQSVIGLGRVCFGTSRDTLITSMGGKSDLGWLWHTGLPLLQILFLWCFALVGVWVSFREEVLPRSVMILLVSTILLTVLAANGMVSNSRFRVPFTPVLCVLAAIGSSSILVRLTTSKQSGTVIRLQL